MSSPETSQLSKSGSSDRGGSLVPVAAVLGAIAVALGAFGAHALKARLIESGTLSTWETATDYLLAHAIAALAIGLARRGGVTWRGSVLSGRLIVVGSIIFSASLFGLALDGPRWLGPITPLGGLLMILGWLALLLPAKKSES